MRLHETTRLQVDSAVARRASAALQEVGLTVADAVEILLTRIADEGAARFALTHESAEHDAWFRGKVEEALAERAGDASEAEIDALFADRRAAALLKVR